MNKFIITRDDKRTSSQIIDEVRMDNKLPMLPGIYKDVYDVAGELNNRKHADIQRFRISCTNGTTGIAYVSQDGYVVVFKLKGSDDVSVNCSRSWAFLRWFGGNEVKRPASMLLDIHYQVKKLSFLSKDSNARKMLFDYINEVREEDPKLPVNKLVCTLDYGVYCVIEPNMVPGSPWVRVTECVGFDSNHIGLINDVDLAGLIHAHRKYRDLVSR